MSPGLRTSVLVAALLSVCCGVTAGQQAPPALPYTARVVEVARSVDLARGGREWLVLTVEIRGSGSDADALGRVQPLREHFRLTDAGGKAHACAWLKGGTSLEDPASLRFQAAFPLPDAPVAKVRLQLLLPRPRPAEIAEFRATSAQLARLPASVEMPHGAIRVDQIAEQPYAAPPLPAAGRHVVKGTPIDTRVFRRPRAAGEKPPQRALLVQWASEATELFDRALELDASVSGIDGKPYPLLSAALERWPSRGTESAGPPPRVFARYWFRTPPKGAAQGLTLRFTLRARDEEHESVDLGEVPVPGR